MFASRYPCVRQIDAADCGPACLASVLRYYGRRVSLTQLRDAARTDLDGTTAYGLIEGANACGMRARGVRAEVLHLPDVLLPAIAHGTKDDRRHYVVLYAVARDHVIVADPELGVRKLTLPQFSDFWSGVLILLAPEGSGAIPSSQMRVWRRLLQLLQPHRALIAEVLASASLFTVLGLATSLYVEALIDEALLQRSSSALHLLGVGMLLAIGFRGAFGAFRSYFLMRIGQRVDAALFMAYYRHLFRLPTRFFDSRPVGEIITRLTDSLYVRELVTGTTATLIIDLGMVIAALGLMMQYDWALSLTALVFVPAFVSVALLLRRPIGDARRKSMEASARFFGSLIESIAGIETVKSLTAEQSVAERTDRYLLPFLQSSFSANGLQIVATTISSVLAALATLTVLWLGAYRVISGALTLGELMAFNALAILMVAPLERLTNATHAVQTGLIAVERLFDVLDLELEETVVGSTGMLPICHGDLALERVTFRYGARASVLNDVSIHIPAGHTVAIVGPSGSGKTTLFRLVQAFYVPESGVVTIDGIDIRLLSPSAVRRHIGVVAQEPYLFSGTIADNIWNGTDGDLDLGRLVAAARDAGVHDFVERLPESYSTRLGPGGVQLSTGERQRLAIARALYRQPRILLMDEITSSLDAVSEHAVRETLRGLKGRTTVLVIAHRLSTIVHADKIVVLSAGGRVVEQGTHSELVALRGAYWNLWHAHSKSAVEDSPKSVRRL